jgi:hypothetical protein
MNFALMLSFFISFDEIVHPRTVIMISTLLAGLLASVMVAFMVTSHW